MADPPAWLSEWQGGAADASVLNRAKQILRPGDTQTSKGSLTVLPAGGAPETVIEFQYNPKSFKVDLSSRLYAAKDGRKPVTGPPSLGFSVTVQLEATREATPPPKGLRPKLAKLELLLYPSLDDIKKNEDNLGAGKIEAVPIEPPKILFKYGQRQIPVRLTGIDIDEQIHDNELNPIVAEVTLKMEAITYSDVPPDDWSYAKSKTYHEQLEESAKG